MDAVNAQDTAAELRGRAASLRADAGRLLDLAEHEERAANAIGFGSDRAANLRRSGQGLLADADRLEDRAVDVERTAAERALYVADVILDTRGECGAVYTAIRTGQDVCARPKGHAGRHDWRGGY